MSKNQPKELQLQKQMEVAIAAITNLGHKIIFKDDRVIRFTYKDASVSFWPDSGFATGSSIKDSRGLGELMNQIRY